MCGVVAINAIDVKKYVNTSILESINHRGPDDNGEFISDQYDVYLGQTRLSILDLSEAGHQPMTDSTGRYVISFNGEIYNYHQLKDNLEKKYGLISWKSNSDTEVIVEGFAREGYHFFSLMNGIFAIALYDKKEKKLHILRDPIGIKPLYYTKQKGGVFFCSEMKGLLAIPNLSRTVRQQSLTEQLAYMYVPEPFTMYNEYKKVTPGIYYVYYNCNLIHSEPIFEFLHSKVNYKSEQEIAKELYQTLSESVKRQMIADVPISLFLSGGLDSSSIAHASVNAGANIKSAYTIAFSEKDNKYDAQSSDVFYAKKMAKILQLELRVINADSNFLSLLPEIIPYMEDGISDPAAINTYIISKAARKDGVKVMLNGQGADEYLCGYRRYKAEYFNHKMPESAKKFLALMSSFVPNSLPGKFNAPVRRFNKLVNSLALPDSQRLPSYFMWSSDDFIKSLFLVPPIEEPSSFLKNFFSDHNHIDSISSMLLADQQFDLLSLNLSYTDKLSMAVGLEARVPFLDFEMVRLMNSIPNNLKIKNGQPKYILKKAMEKYLPHEVIYRSKAGFALPIRSWFRESNNLIEKYFNSDRIKKQGIYDFRKLEILLTKQFSGNSEYSYLIFSLLCQQIWLEEQNGF